MGQNCSIFCAPKRSEGTEGGFTLLEILVAVTILGIVMATVYGTTATTLSSTRYAEERAEVDSLGREVVLRIADEIEGALPLGFFGIPGNERVPADAVQFIAVVQRRGVTRGRGGRAVVSYSLDPLDDTQSIFALRRHEELLLDDVAGAGGAEGEDEFEGDEDEFDDGEEFAAEEGGLESVSGSSLLGPVVSDVYLLDNVVGLQFRYFDAETGEFVSEWNAGEDVDGQIIRGLPGAVEILLLLADANGGIHDFRTHADLPLARIRPTPGAL